MEVDLNNFTKESKQDYAYKRIKEMIISNQLPAETVLVERNLCDLLNLSRTPIRGALQELVKDKLVTNYPSRGMVVSRIELQDFFDIFEIRDVLDVLAIKLFMKGDHPDVVEKMHNNVENMKIALENEDYKTFIIEDSSFHDGYINNCGNNKLKDVLSMLSDQIVRFLNLTAQDHSRGLHTWEEHKNIIDAVEAGDVDKAMEMVHQHITNSLEYHVRRAARR